MNSGWWHVFQGLVRMYVVAFLAEGAKPTLLDGETIVGGRVASALSMRCTRS